jgi:uncharacterized protein YpmB
MPNSATAEVYFIAAMMILILILCGAAVFFFFKTYKKEMREREARKLARKKQKEYVEK